MKLCIFVALLCFFLAAEAQRDYFFQTVSSPGFDGDDDDRLELPLRSTRTVIFSIDTPLFRDTFYTFSKLDSVDDNDSVSPIGWAGPIPDFQTDNAASLSASIALLVATVALFI